MSEPSQLSGSSDNLTESNTKVRLIKADGFLLQLNVATFMSAARCFLVGERRNLQWRVQKNKTLRGQISVSGETVKFFNSKFQCTKLKITFDRYLGNFDF